MHIKTLRHGRKAYLKLFGSRRPTRRTTMRTISLCRIKRMEIQIQTTMMTISKPYSWKIWNALHQKDQRTCKRKNHLGAKQSNSRWTRTTSAMKHLSGKLQLRCSARRSSNRILPSMSITRGIRQRKMRCLMIRECYFSPSPPLKHLVEAILGNLRRRAR